ncbi:MAG: hypothetical protein KC713_05400 [Candidatus Omnitrophica bacterium]|nr:hypothetical protein [Candidatus Omnitrophota bacterium]
MNDLSRLRILLKDIKDEGLVYTRSLDQNFVELGPEEYVHFIRPIDVRAKIFRAEDTVIADIQISSRIKAYCARTLEPLERDFHLKCMLDYEIEPKTEFIELGDDIRQEIIVGLPVRLVSDDSEGLFEISKDEDRIHKENNEHTHQPFANLNLPTEENDEK